MPVSFLTPAQHQQYGRYTADPSAAQLARFFRLDDRDRPLVTRCIVDVRTYAAAPTHRFARIDGRPRSGAMPAIQHRPLSGTPLTFQGPTPFSVPASSAAAATCSPVSPAIVRRFLPIRS